MFEMLLSTLPVRLFLSTYSLEPLIIESRQVAALTAFIGGDVRGAAERSWFVYGGWRQMSRGSSQCNFARMMKVFSWAVYTMFVYIPGLGLLDVYPVVVPRDFAQVVTPVRSCVYYFSSIQRRQVGPLDLVLLPGAVLHQGILGSFPKQVNKTSLWETIPFMLDDCCDNVALPLLPLLVASVCQDKQTSRQHSRGLGLLRGTCQASLPPLRCGAFLFQPRTLPANLKWFRLPIFSGTAKTETTCESTRRSCFTSI